MFIHDIDGLKKGSPVKIMGVGVGYITEINIVDDYMYISFMVTKKDVSIPHGSVAKIESYGIAGSKSIELYPPKEKADTTKPVLFVEEPIRSSSTYNSQGSIQKSLILISEGTSAMLNKKTTEQHQKNIQNLKLLTESVDFSDIDKNADNAVKIMKQNKKKREEINE